MDDEALADRLLGATAPIVSEMHERFGAWFAAGTAAALALFIGNVDKMLLNLSHGYFLGACVLLLLSLACFAIQRWSAYNIQSTGLAAKAINAMGDDFGENNDMQRVAEIMTAQSLWPFSSNMRSAIGSSRRVGAISARRAQRQTLGLFVQLFLLFVAAVLLLAGIAIKEEVPAGLPGRDVECRCELPKGPSAAGVLREGGTKPANPPAVGNEHHARGPDAPIATRVPK